MDMRAEIQYEHWIVKFSNLWAINISTATDLTDISNWWRAKIHNYIVWHAKYYYAYNV